MTRSRSFLFLVATLLVVATNYRVRSSPAPSHHPPSATPTHYASPPSSARALPPAAAPPAAPPPPSRPAAASVTFVYELYEHEVHDPRTDGWTARRFTQSPVAGGGGRDSTSLEPGACAPPRNYRFEGEWKIDMASDARDGFGWEYYAGRYDGLGRRRRRWFRTLRRMSGASGVAKRRAGKGPPATSALSAATKERRPSVLQAVRNQYNFKGFGWSFFKSFVWARSVGAALRIPISANFDAYDRCLAAPYVSSATYVGFPWIVATFLSASVPLEVPRWLVGGVAWKIRWGAAVLSACVRGLAEALLWLALRPWRLGRATAPATAWMAGGSGLAEPEAHVAKAVDIDATRNTTEAVEEAEETVVSIDTHIEPTGASEFGVDGGTGAVSATAVADGPRGGASHPKPRTVFGRPIPAFHRPYALEYSATVQERIGVVVSWRVSQARGYVYHCNLSYTCLPTRLFWGRAEEERRRRVAAALRRVGLGGTGTAPPSADAAGEGDAAGAAAPRRAPAPGSFWRDHSAALGLSSAWPVPVDPYVNCSLMLSLSGFFYGWVLDALRARAAARPPPPSRAPAAAAAGRNATAAAAGDVGERLVSSALKNKARRDDARDPGDADDEGRIAHAVEPLEDEPELEKSP